MQIKNKLALFAIYAITVPLHGDQEPQPKTDGKYKNTWNIGFSADYLYWKWQQDSFQLGTIVDFSLTKDTDFNGNTQAIFENPKYKSGFQVGADFQSENMDKWNLYSEYTWYTSSANGHITGTPDNPFIISSSHFITPDNIIAGATLIGTINTHISLGFQSLDFLARRFFDWGKRSKATCSMGLKAEWIHQTLKSTSSYLLSGNNIFTDHYYFGNLSSWGLGPKLAFSPNWGLGYGIKIIASLAESVLYTSYNSTAALYNIFNGTASQGSANYLHNYGTLRSVTESFLGLGWENDFCNNRLHTNFSIGYDFNMYWNYNMLTYALSQVLGNMYLHGLNIQARLDF